MAVLACSDQETVNWQATVTPTSGKFMRGTADVTAVATGTENVEGATASHQGRTVTVTLGR